MFFILDALNFIYQWFAGAVYITSLLCLSSRMATKQRFWLVCKVQFWLGIAFAIAKPHEGIGFAELAQYAPFLRQLG